jgi:uncharacterized protein (AIM24 family)
VLCAWSASQHGLLRRFGAGLFGGKGFMLQKLSGDGLAFVNPGGHIIERSLATR